MTLAPSLSLTSSLTLLCTYLSLSLLFSLSLVFSQAFFKKLSPVARRVASLFQLARALLGLLSLPPLLSLPSSSVYRFLHVSRYWLLPELWVSMPEPEPSRFL